MKYLYHLITDEERAEWTDLRGAEFQDFVAKMRAKYLAKLNDDFSTLHPDNQRRIRDICEISDTVCATLLECGDVWLKDVHELDRRRMDLKDMMRGMVDKFKEGDAE